MRELDIQPQRFGTYLLVQGTARGSRTETFRAFDVRSRERLRPVTLRRLLVHLKDEDRAPERALAAFRLVAGINHPNLAGVEEIGEENGIAYMVSGHLLGRSLAELVEAARRKQRQVPLDAACTILHEVLCGLEQLHRRQRSTEARSVAEPRGMLPGNLFISFDGRVCISDFGIADVEQTMVHTVGGLIKGKSTYMSPEQAGNERMDHRADLFSLGLIFYELVTLCQPYAGRHVPDVLEAILAGRVPRLRLHRPDAPAELEGQLLRVLDPDPDERYQDASAWRSSLQEIITGHRLPCSADVVAGLVQRLFPGAFDRERDRLERERLAVMAHLGWDANDEPAPPMPESRPTRPELPARGQPKRQHKITVRARLDVPTDPDAEEDLESTLEIKAPVWDQQDTMEARPVGRDERGGSGNQGRPGNQGRS